MSTLAERVREHRQEQADVYAAVMRGDTLPPPCRCGRPATHVTDKITPAGYHHWACDGCARTEPDELWGSDPGWRTVHVPVEEASARRTATR